MDWGERQLQVLRVLEMMEDGASPAQLGRELGISTLYAAILLSRFHRQGIVVRKKAGRYYLTPKGERKLAYLEEK